MPDGSAGDCGCLAVVAIIPARPVDVPGVAGQGCRRQNQKHGQNRKSDERCTFHRCFLLFVYCLSNAICLNALQRNHVFTSPFYLLNATFLAKRGHFNQPACGYPTSRPLPLQLLWAQSPGYCTLACSSDTYPVSD